MKKDGRLHNASIKAKLDVAVSKEVTSIAANILRGEHGIEHLPGVRDDLCPLCIDFRKLVPK